MTDFSAQKNIFAQVTYVVDKLCGLSQILHARPYCWYCVHSLQSSFESPIKLRRVNSALLDDETSTAGNVYQLAEKLKNHNRNLSTQIPKDTFAVCHDWKREIQNWKFPSTRECARASPHANFGVAWFGGCKKKVTRKMIWNLQKIFPNIQIKSRRVKMPHKKKRGRRSLSWSAHEHEPAMGIVIRCISRSLVGRERELSRRAFESDHDVMFFQAFRQRARDFWQHKKKNESSIHITQFSLIFLSTPPLFAYSRPMIHVVDEIASKQDDLFWTPLSRLCQCTRWADWWGTINFHSWSSLSCVLARRWLGENWMMRRFESQLIFHFEESHLSGGEAL